MRVRIKEVMLRECRVFEDFGDKGSYGVSRPMVMMGWIKGSMAHRSAHSKKI